MKIKIKILAMILIAVLAVSSVTFADRVGLDKVNYGANSPESELGSVTPFSTDIPGGSIVPGPDNLFNISLSVGMYKFIDKAYISLVSAIVNSSDSSIVNIYKYHIEYQNGIGYFKFDSERLTKDSDLTLSSISRGYIIEGAHKGTFNTDFLGVSPGSGSDVISTRYYVKANVTKKNVDFDIGLPDGKLNPNAKTQNVPVNIVPNYQEAGDPDPIVDDLKIYLEFKYLDNGNIKTFKSDTFSATSAKRDIDTGSVSTYNIATPYLRGNTDYDVSVKVAPENNDVYQISDPLKNYKTQTKIRPKFEIISGAGNANGNVGYAKDVGFTHVVSYRLLDENNNQPLVNQTIDFPGLAKTTSTITGYSNQAPTRWGFGLGFGQQPIYTTTTTPYLADTNENGIINTNYKSFGNYNLAASYAGDGDIAPANIGQKTLSIKKLAGAGKQIITHVASWGSAFKASHWTSSNGFSFQNDNNWILAFIADTTLKFYDIDGKQIGSDNHFTQTSGSDIKYVNVPDNAATMSITCGAQSSGDHTTKSGLEAGKGAINYDGTVAGKWSTKNCHVKTDTW
ncbi:MAG: hypothetical protein LBT66_04070, partial [Methanobrevibacter sp.]|nr:hypothetical protein [Candidatus Methanovirga meridionalis]